MRSSIYSTVRPILFVESGQTDMDGSGQVLRLQASLETPSMYGASQNSPPRSSHASPGNTLQFSPHGYTVSHRTAASVVNLLDESSVQECMHGDKSRGACLRFWPVVGQVVPLHRVHPPARLRRRRGELGLREHLPDARVAAEQVAGLHREHPASSTNTHVAVITDPNSNHQNKLYTDHSDQSLSQG